MREHGQPRSNSVEDAAQLLQIKASDEKAELEMSCV